MRRKTLSTPWSSISDLMSALMMVFLFISVGFNFLVTKQSEKLSQNAKEIRKITSDYNERRAEIYNALQKKFGARLREWNASLDSKTLTMRFDNSALLFEAGKADLKPDFSRIVSEFWPEYVEILYRNSDLIREVRIEGHTSSEWLNADLSQSYFNNMELSQARTRETLELCYSVTPAEKLNWVRSFVTANGMSFSRPVLAKGIEDIERSRRVEFSVVVDSDESLEKIIGEMND